ncbi:putative lipoprotein precursor [alpha proteobacterium U9-1i]|nr:putative lipoprotein precursor [alpha proteobacterium U9-1i]
MEGDVFVLVEDFEYDDGERDRKTWRLRRVSEGRYSGTREDVVGEAVAFQDGPALRLEYDVRLPGEDGRPGRKVRFRDVLVRTGDGILNRANVGLFGLRVARVELTISP